VAEQGRFSVDRGPATGSLRLAANSAMAFHMRWSGRRVRSDFDWSLTLYIFIDQ